jgi:hypothetical protein
VISPDVAPDELRSRLRLLLEHASLRRRLDAAETALGRAAGAGGDRVGGNPNPTGTEAAATRR